MLSCQVSVAQTLDFNTVINEFRNAGIDGVDKAITDLTQLAESDSGSNAIYSTLADVLYVRYQYRDHKLTDVRAALGFMNKVIAVTASADNYQKRGLYHLILGDSGAASRDLILATSIQPKHVEAWSLRIELLLSLKQIKKADSLAYEALSNWNDLSLPAAEIAKIFYINEHWEIALDLFALVEHKSAEDQFTQGVSYEKLAQNKAAISAYRQSLELKNSDTTRYRLARLLIQSHQDETALEQIRILLRSTPKSAEVWQLLAQAYSQTNNAARAVAAWVNVKRFAVGMLADQASKNINQLSVHL